MQNQIEQKVENLDTLRKRIRIHDCSPIKEIIFKRSASEPNRFINLAIQIEEKEI